MPEKIRYLFDLIKHLPNLKILNLSSNFLVCFFFFDPRLGCNLRTAGFRNFVKEFDKIQSKLELNLSGKKTWSEFLIHTIISCLDNQIIIEQFSDFEGLWNLKIRTQTFSFSSNAKDEIFS